MIYQMSLENNGKLWRRIPTMISTSRRLYSKMTIFQRNNFNWLLNTCTILIFRIYNFRIVFRVTEKGKIITAWCKWFLNNDNESNFIYITVIRIFTYYTTVTFLFHLQNIKFTIQQITLKIEITTIREIAYACNFNTKFWENCWTIHLNSQDIF